MDYREIENRLARNRDMIKERQNDHLIEELKQANNGKRGSWLAGLRSLFASFKIRKSQPQPQPQVRLKPQRQFEQR